MNRELSFIVTTFKQIYDWRNKKWQQIPASKKNHKKSQVKCDRYAFIDIEMASKLNHFDLNVCF
jgi:hypothetical protein